MRDRRTYLRSIATVAATAALAGCTGNGGDDGGNGGGGGNDATPTETATPTDAPVGTTMGSGSGGSDAQSEYPDYDWGQLDSAEPTATAMVTMSGFAFDPLIGRVPPGTTLSFPNEDSAPHTVTIPALGVDEQVDSGGETTVIVEDPGTYDYVCKFHGPSMLGRLVVEEGVTLDEDDGMTGGTTTTDDGGMY